MSTIPTNNMTILPPSDRIDNQTQTSSLSTNAWFWIAIALAICTIILIILLLLARPGERHPVINIDNIS